MVSAVCQSLWSLTLAKFNGLQFLPKLNGFNSLMKSTSAYCLPKFMVSAVYHIVTFCQSLITTVASTGARVAQWVKCWPTDLAVLSSSPA